MVTPTPGWQTTEFWGKVIVQLIGIAVALGFIHPLNVTDPATAVAIQTLAGLLAIVVPEIVYAISRAMVKKAALTGTAQIQQTTHLLALSSGHGVDPPPLNTLSLADSKPRSHHKAPPPTEPTT